MCSQEPPSSGLEETLFWSVNEMRGDCQPFDLRFQTAPPAAPRSHLCAPYPGPCRSRPWAAAPPPRRGPSVTGRGVVGSGSPGPTGCFLLSLPPWLPPAGSGTAATSESASLCALCSRRAAPSSARTAGGRAGSAAPRGWPGWEPRVRRNLVLVLVPGLPPTTTTSNSNIPFLRCLSFSRGLLPCVKVPSALGPQVSPISWYL